MSGLYLVADDLTGALDSAAPFCARYGPIPVFLGVPHPCEPAHAAVDLATRDSVPTQAGASSALVLQRLAGASLPYKKIDSRLRGHWDVELAALLREGAFGGCVFAPAFPSQGRATREGLQWVSDADGVPLAVPEEPLRRLQALGLKLRHAGTGDATRAAAARLAESNVVVFDATTDADLEAIADAVPARVRGKPVLWCGSGGLARALARGAVPVPAGDTPARPALAIIGTDHPVARAQVVQASARLTSERHIVVRRDIGQAALRIGHLLDLGHNALLSFEFPDDVDRHYAAVGIEQALNALIPALPRPASIIVAGGQTLLAVCRGAGATHLVVTGEQSPGVPCSRLQGGAWHGTEVVSKSGGFGTEEWLAALL